MWKVFHPPAGYDISLWGERRVCVGEARCAYHYLLCLLSETIVQREADFFFSMVRCTSLDQEERTQAVNEEVYSRELKLLRKLAT